jgi:capsular polysaccharide transport system permease protein
MQVFLAVQNALILRELSMRFSSGRMGLFWTFFEPFFQILVFVLIKITLFGRSNSDFDFAVFLALNFIAFNLFKNIVTKSINAFKANKALFLYKQVKPIDTIIARVIVEIFITAIIILMFLTIGLYFNFDIAVKDISMVAFGFLFLTLFSFSFALVLSVLNIFVDSVGKLIGFSLTALMFASAVFYTLDMIPLELQRLLLYNPLIHFMEMIHGFYFIVLDDAYVDYYYISLWTFSLLFIGLWSYVKLEKRIISL